MTEANSQPPRARGSVTPRLLGRYHVLGRIGQSAAGALHLARLEGPEGFQRWAAVRVVDKSRAADPEFHREFFDRASAGAALLHPNVAALFDVGETEGIPWLASEYLQGERVEELIHRAHLAGTPLPWDVAARVVADASLGLFALHEHTRPDGSAVGLEHGDVAPHNLIVTYTGETKVKGAFEPRARGTLDRRKLPYAAPEQLWGEAIDARTDVFALGVILWELCAAMRLFARDTDDETRASVEAGLVPSLCDEVQGFPAEVDALVRRALSHDKAERFANARELSRALESALVSRGVLTRTEDVGALMARLFADRIRQRSNELKDASEVTEVFSRTRRRLTLPKAPRDESGLIDLSVRDAEAEPTALSDSDELPTRTHDTLSLRASTDDLSATLERDAVRSVPPLPPPEIGAPEAPTDEVDAASAAFAEYTQQATKDIPTRVRRPSFADVPPVERRAPPVQRLSIPPPLPARASRPSLPPPSIPPPPSIAPPPAAFVPPPAYLHLPPVGGAPYALPPMPEEPRRGRAAVAGVAVAVVLFGGFLLAMETRSDAPTVAVATTASNSATARVRSAPSMTSAPVATAPVSTIESVQASDLPISTSKPPVTTARPVVTSPRGTSAPVSKATGQLTVICMPACDQVLEGGRSMGPSPIFKRTVPAGSHRLTLRGEGGAQKIVTVEVPEGDTAVVKQPM